MIKSTHTWNLSARPLLAFPAGRGFDVTVVWTLPELLGSFPLRQDARGELRSSGLSLTELASGEVVDATAFEHEACVNALDSLLEPARVRCCGSSWLNSVAWDSVVGDVDCTWSSLVDALRKQKATWWPSTCSLVCSSFSFSTERGRVLTTTL